MSSRPAITERHLAMLDELAEIGMVLARRLGDLPPLVGQDTARDFDLIACAVRRSILLFHTIADGLLTPVVPRPERDPAANPNPTERDREAAGFRQEAGDRLDDISGPFEHIVAGIIQDLQAAIATSHGPKTPEPTPSFAHAAPPTAGIEPDRPEADSADLN